MPLNDLKLYLFGLPRVKHNGTVVKFERRKAMALLAYLTVTKDQHSREALATLLWPDTEPSRAFSYLRTVIWTLNKTPVAEWLQIDQESIKVKDGLWLDVTQFRRRLDACQEHNHHDFEVCDACFPLLTEAVELYRGDFMAGFILGDSLVFDEWQFFNTQTLRQEYASVLEKLVYFHKTRKEFEPAIAYARQWLTLDPLNEVVQRHLMTLYAWSDQRAMALRQYNEYLRILQDLNATPDDETIELHRRILTRELRGTKKLAKVVTTLNNLPVYRSPFVGRDVELAEIRRLLNRPDCRLLTITGLGGSGKTRLALQIVNEWKEAFPDGIFFIPLAPVNDFKLIVPTIIDALHISLSLHQGAQSPLQEDQLQTQLYDYLCDKQMLLVLDNVEHLLEGVELIGKILDNAPDVKFLVTSRERLNLSSEWVFEIAGLRFPTQGTMMMTDDFETFSALQLFFQSANRAQANFSPTTEDKTAVIRICQLVEGVPLAIELAAVWVKTFSCQEIAAEIEKSLDFLTSPLRDVPERHQSLRAVFDRSWALLSEDERACLRRLAVFCGGFTREAAQDVTGASLVILSSLIDKSLLRRAAIGHYEMHEMLRQYAEERLSASQENTVTRDRHCEYYMALLGRVEPALKGAGQKDALETLRCEIENVRAAWYWAIAHNKIIHIREAAMSLFLFCDIQSRFQEGAEMFQATEVLSKQENQLSDTKEKARQAFLGMAFAAQGWFLLCSSRARAQELYKRSLVYLEPLGPCKELAFAYLLSAFSYETSYMGSEWRLQQSLAIYEANGDHWGMAMVLGMLAEALVEEDIIAAEHCAQQSLELRRQLGDQWGIALALFTRGWIAERRGWMQQARQYYCESLELRRDIGKDLAGIVICLSRIARLASHTGDYDQAHKLFLEGLTLSREINHRWYIMGFLRNLGTVAYYQEKHSLAKHYYEKSLALSDALGARRDAAITAEMLGRAVLALGDYKGARCCFLHSLSIEAGNPWALLGLGRLSATLGDKSAAYEYYRQALHHTMDLPKVLAYYAETTILRILIGLARLWFKEKMPEQALELLGFCLHHHQIGHHFKTQAEKLLTEIAAVLPATATKSALTTGKTYDLAAIVEKIQAGTFLSKSPPDNKRVSVGETTSPV